MLRSKIARNWLAGSGLGAAHGHTQAHQTEITNLLRGDARPRNTSDHMLALCLHQFPQFPAAPYRDPVGGTENIQLTVSVFSKTVNPRLDSQ